MMHLQRLVVEVWSEEGENGYEMLHIYNPKTDTEVGSIGGQNE